MDDDKFFLCFVDGETECVLTRYSYDQAKREAERLAQKPENIGRTVYLMVSVEFCRLEYYPMLWGKVGNP